MRMLLTIASMVIIPKFVLVHPTVDRAIRINSEQILFYEDYIPEDLYYKGRLYLLDGSNIAVIESADEIDLMFQDEYSAGKK